MPHPCLTAPRLGDSEIRAKRDAATVESRRRVEAARLALIAKIAALQREAEQQMAVADAQRDCDAAAQNYMECSMLCAQVSWGVGTGHYRPI
jgi:hypothetical protein